MLTSLRERRSGSSVPVSAILVVLLVVFGLQLRSSQASSRADLIDRFTDSAVNNAALTQALFSSSSAASAAELTRQLGGDDVSRRRLDVWIRRGGGQAPYAVLVDDGGRILASSKNAPASAIAAIGEVPEFVSAALGQSGFGLSGWNAESGDGRVVEFAQAFAAADGTRRVIASGVDSKVLTEFLGGYLEQTRQLEGGDAYIIDDTGYVIASTASRSPAGQPITEPDLLSGALTENEGGYGGDRHFASVPIEGTGWRVVATAPTSELLAAVTGTNKWVPWLIFGAFAMAAVAALALLRRTIAGAADLRRVNDQLGDTNQQLEARAKELKRSNEELEQFASIASHDLSEPLRKVQMFSRRLQEVEAAQLSARGEDYINRMIAAAERMETLIRDLLEFSRVTTRGNPFSRVDLGEVFHAAVADLEVSVAESGAKIEIGTLPVVAADPLQMRQLAQNLISNAVKFHRDGDPPRVQVHGEIQDGIARVVVADDGIGFDPRYAGRIFRVFERLHGRSAYRGTGIGLALCRKIAERHGGGIVAEGRLGDGATFTVELPVVQAGLNGANGVGTEPSQSITELAGAAA